jgi:ATP-binding cassette subfamily B protein
VSASEYRSKLLQQDLPQELREDLSGAGVSADRIWLCADTDLNLLGGYQRMFVMASPDELLVGGQSNGYQAPPIKRISRTDITEVRARQGVGGGFMQVMVEGVWVDVLAYSNAKADLAHKAIGKLQKWVKGETPAMVPADDVDDRKCSKCGLTLQFKGDVCRRCVDRGAIMLRVLKLMRPYASRAAVMMALVIIGIVLTLVPGQINRYMTDVVLVPAVSGKGMEYVLALTFVAMLVGGILLTRLIEMIVHMIDGRIGSYVATQVTYDVRKRVFEHLTRLSVDYFDRYNVGQLISRVSGDTEQMRQFVHQMTHGFLRDIIMIIAVGSTLFAMNWKLALVTLLPAPLVVLCAVFFWKRVYPRYYRVWDANSRLAGTLNTILSGIRVVKAFAQEPREHKRFDRSASYVRESFRSVEYQGSKFHPFVGFVFQLGGMVVWFMGGMMVLKGEVSLGTLQAFLGYLWMFYQPLGSLAQVTNWLTGFLTAAQRTFEILDTPEQVAESASPVGVSQMNGRIVFENVTFGYDRHQPVLKGVSFSIAPGEKIGVVGKSGSGKTTIINLLSRFYDVDGGRVLIDGVDVRDMSKDDLRRQVGVVLQEPFLFRGTIYDNLTYGFGDAPPEKVIAAAKAANCHDFIMRHPLGYDTYVGERGSGLSGGERQRISIARALLYDPVVLILDEATSSVDTESEKLIQDALKRITQGRTTIAIAHRLSTLKNSDRIFVVDHGKIAEQGTHEELLAAKGIYHTLVKIQTELSSEKNIDELAGAGVKR